MKKRLLISLIFALLPFIIFAQRSKKKKKNVITVSTGLNYYPDFDPYIFFGNFTLEDTDLVLNFLTQNSGTFVIEDIESIRINRVHTNNLPVNRLGLGFGWQFRNKKNWFHELSLTKLHFSKSEQSIGYFYQDTLGNLITETGTGFKNKTSVFGFRYEFGKYFGNQKLPPVRFGLSVAFEPSFYKHEKTPVFISTFPVTAKITTFDIALIPVISVKLSKRVYVDLKAIPNLLFAYSEKVEERNPEVPIKFQKKENFSRYDFSLSYSFMLRYQINENRRKR